MSQPTDEPSKHEIALMVYDATLALLVHFLRPDVPDFVKSQIEAAREACLHATGVESLCYFSRPIEGQSCSKSS